MHTRTLFFFACAISAVSACSKLDCPTGQTRIGDVCWDCDPGMVPGDEGVCVPAPPDAAVEIMSVVADDSGQSSAPTEAGTTPLDGSAALATDAGTTRDASAVGCENAGCAQLCNAPDGGAPTCSCNAGYKLAADQRGCVAFEWGPVERVSAVGFGANEPSLAVSANGIAAAVWWQQNAALSDTEVWGTPYVDGRWQPPTKLSTMTKGVEAQVALNDKGRGIAVWSQAGTDRMPLLWARTIEGGSWGIAAPIGSARETEPTQVTPVVDAKGNALVVWTSLENDPQTHLTSYAKRGAEYSADTTNWSSSFVSLGMPTTRATMAPAGVHSPSTERFWTAWTVRDPALPRADLWLLLKVGSQWRPAIKVADDVRPDQQPALIADRSGDAVVAWAGNDFELRVVGCKAAGCGAPQSLGGCTGLAPLAASNGNRMMIAWQRSSEEWSWSERIESAPFSSAKPIAIRSSAVRLVMDSAGNATMAWEKSEADHSTTRIWHSRRPADGEWQVPRILQTGDGSASHVQLGVDEQGRVTSAWLQEATTTQMELVSRRLE